MCFVWISEQTAIISLYNINWPVFVTETLCLLRGTDWVFMNESGQSQSSKAALVGHLMECRFAARHETCLFRQITFSDWFQAPNS